MEYPKMLYFKGDVSNQKIVNSAEEENALGEDWIDAPIDPTAPAPAPAPAQKPKK